MSRAPFEVVEWGVDDITIGFDMTGSGCVDRLNRAPGFESRRGKMLGDRSSWGSFAHLLGRSVSFWRSETSRLYVQAKLADEGCLCPVDRMRVAVDGLLIRMAVVGIESFEPAWVTRVDVAVDAVCQPTDGKLLLDALEASRLPNGWRTRSVGVPRSTVYFTARMSERVKARSYCRNLKTKAGTPFGRIRLEAEARYEPGDKAMEEVLEPAFLGEVWLSRFGALTGTVMRLGRETQTIGLAALVESGVLTYAQGERVGMFLDLERTGLSEGYYPPSVLQSRRREIRRFGLSANDRGSESLEVDLNEMLEPFRHVAATYRECGSRRGVAVSPPRQRR